MKTYTDQITVKNLTLGLAALVMMIMTTACGSSNNNNTPPVAGFGVGINCAGCPGGATTQLTSALADNFTLYGGVARVQQPVQLALEFFGTGPMQLAQDGMPALYGQVAAAGVLQLWAPNGCGLAAGQYQVSTIQLGSIPADGLAWGPIYLQVQGTPITIGIAGTFDGSGPLTSAAGQTFPYRWGGEIRYYASGPQGQECAIQDVQ